MSLPLKILLLEDNRADAEMIQRVLTKANMSCRFHLSMDKNDFLKALDAFSPSIILSDHSLPQFNSSDALLTARSKFPGIPFIMVTGTASEEFAAHIIKLGADDYILKDRMARLPAAINAALQQRKALKEVNDYKYALDHSAIVAITDQKGIILYANENFCRISKFSANELLGQDHRIISSGYHSPRFIKNLWQTIARGNIWRGEFCNKAKDGELYWVDTTIIPFLNEKGKPYQYLSIRIDITEKKKAEGLVKISEEKYRTLFLKSPLPKWIYDNETLKFVEVNEAAIRHYGYSREEFLNMTIKDIRPAEDLALLLEDVKKIKPGSETNRGNWRHLKKNGELIIVETLAHPIDYDNRKTRMVIVNDITEKLKAEEVIRKSEMRLKEAQAIAHISNYEVDLVTKIHTWSDEYFRIFGIRKNEATPSLDLFLSFIHPDDAESIKKKVAQIFRNYENSFFNFRFIRRDGMTRHGYSEWKFEFDKNKNPVRLFGILQDITERKEAEENLKLLEQKMLEQKIQEQKKIARAIIKAQEKERNHIGQELHDNINQMLAGTKMYLSIAGKKNSDVKEAISYPIELINTIIEEIRILCQKLATPVKNIDLKEMIQELLYSFRANLPAKTSLSYNVITEKISDELKLNIYRIIQEQVTNISKYAKAKKVKISLTERNKAIIIITEDDGKGFDVDAKRKGIGISNMVNRSGSFNGWVELRSEPGKGCRITVSIPFENA
ncbi:MAG TPA: PAS domain S-box protein [Ferruginibacter sp.]|nr:PAS domain S-box protein [Ferruginibacter sp.]